MSDSTKAVITFLAKGVAAYGLWYIAYDLWLLPDGRLDAWLSENVAAVTGHLLTAVGFDSTVDGRSVLMTGVPGIRIVNGCNGLSTIGLFIGFVVAYPGRLLHRLWFIPMGILVIYATNVVRAATMLLVQQYWPAAFDPLHGFGLTTIFYVVVFGLWVAWTRLGAREAFASSSASVPVAS